MMCQMTIVVLSGNFNISCIIFKNLEMLKNKIQRPKFYEKIFKNISFVEIKTSKIINYPTYMC
jgi:hypothetical protein